MKLGLSSAAFYGRMETEDQAAHLTDFPADVCEIFLQTFSEYTADFGRMVQGMLCGKPCVSIHAKGTQFEPDIFSRSARQMEDALRLFDGACAAGQVLGAQYYVFHGPGSTHGALPPNRVNALSERFARMQGIAAAHGMEVLWENVSWCSIRTPDDIRTAQTLLPGVGFVLDVKQAFRSGQNVADMLDAMGPSVRHIHALDWDANGCLCLPGSGMLDWPLLLRRLRDSGYDGAVILEPYDWQARDEDALRRSLDFLRNAISQAGCLDGCTP